MLKNIRFYSKRIQLIDKIAIHFTTMESEELLNQRNPEREELLDLKEQQKKHEISGGC